MITTTRNTIVTILTATFLLTACNTGGVWTQTSTNPGKSEYDYIGCHKATETNLSTDGAITFGPFGVGTWTSAGNVYFKQKNADGTTSKTTLKKC